MRSVRALLAIQLCVSGAFAQARPEHAPAPTSQNVAARQLSITVVTSEPDVPTLRERVGSWFRDGTEVSVGVASALPSERLFAARASEVQVWVVRLSAERALVLFATAAGPEGGRYLLREVRLVSGFDELGLERLASVIHTASVALREGVEGAERPQVERELVEAGLLPGTASSEPPPPAARAAPAPAEPPRSRSPASDASVAPAARTAPSTGLLLAAGYAARARGAEHWGHGPLVTAGLQLPGSAMSFDALLSAHLLFRSEFEAGALAASVQTSAFRAHVGLEPALSERLRLQALLGAGADLAQVSAHPREGSSDSPLSVRDPGSQWRAALELSLGLWWRGSFVDLGAALYSSFLLGDVHYSLRSEGMEQRLVTPWPVQPGLSLQARFRSTP